MSDYITRDDLDDYVASMRREIRKLINQNIKHAARINKLENEITILTEMLAIVIAATKKEKPHARTQ